MAVTTRGAPANRRTERLRASIANFLTFFEGPYDALQNQPDVANFAVGNPQERAMPAYVDAIRTHLEPQNKDWFAYKLSEPNARATVARSMSNVTGLEWDDEDVHMTHGGFAALAVSFRTLLQDGDEAIYLSPPWFFYEHLILAAGGLPVSVPFEMPDCDLDVTAIERAITPRTRVVVLNSPHNPSGRIVPLDDLRALADMLTRASDRNGSPIYLVSDEPYRRIVFDGREFHSPAEVYPNTIVTYSYGKQLLAPGMRIGYITWPPTMDRADRERLRDDVSINQMASGWAFPNADLQHAIEELEPMCVDLGALERRRDRVVSALRATGYEATSPEATFYVMARSPIADDVRFAALLNERRVLVLPGSIVNAPGWFRISLTASDEMVDRGLPGFDDAYRTAAAGA
jgi:aspartate aminotransferase